MRVRKEKTNKKEKNGKRKNPGSSSKSVISPDTGYNSGIYEFDVSENDSEFIDDFEKEEADSETLFLEEVSRFETEHEKTRIINLYKFIGKPKVKKVSELDNKNIKNEYDRLIAILDEKRIIVHFQNEYPVREKYRFITEEIFRQDVEDLSDTHLHINFIYEDFHPEMDEDDEEY